MQDFAEADAPVLDTALEHARARNTLAKLTGDGLGILSSQELEPRGVAADATNAPARQGYQLARELRRTLGNDADALTDLRELAEATCGITVLVRRLTTIGSSAFAVKAQDAAAILLAPITYLREPIARVWIAHELCHTLFDVDAGGVHVVVDFDGDRHVHDATALGTVMPYLLDTQVVSFFLQARREADLAAAAAVMPCAIADEVRGELAEDPTRGRLFEQWLPSSHVEVIAIPVGGPADALLTRLQTGLVTRRGRGTRNQRQDPHVRV